MSAHWERRGRGRGPRVRTKGPTYSAAAARAAFGLAAPGMRLAAAVRMAELTHFKRNRWLLIAAIVLAVLALAGVAAFHFAARSVKGSIEQALGPEGEAAAINVGLTSVEILDVRIKAPKGWPSDSTLRARRIVIVPDLRELLSDRVRITRVDVQGAYLSALRPKEGGGLRVLPSIADRAKKNKGPGKARRGAIVSTVQLTDCVIEVYDATVAGKPQKLRVDAVKGTVEDIRLPELTNRTRIDLAGVSKGENRNGAITVRGWVEVANRDAELDTRVRNVGLAHFEPYVITKLKSGIDSGSFNLDLKSRVTKNFVTATGTLTVVALTLAPSENPLGAIAALPRAAMIGVLENEQEEITVPFKIEGDLDDPAFSLTGEGVLQTAVAVVKAFGASFEGLVRALLILVNGFASAFRALVPG